jgi:hypothetical protein
MRRAAFAWALAAAVACAAPSFAQEQVEQAKTYFNAGAQAFDAGQFQAAAQAFEQAYKLAPRPAILFSLAQAHKRQYFIDKAPDTLRRAIASYREYLGKVASGGRRSDAAQALAELEPMAAKLGADTSAPPPASAQQQTRLMISSQTSGAQVALDSDKAVAAPLIAEVKPGKHHLKVTAPGFFDETRDVAAAEGGVVALDLALREKPARIFFTGDSGSEITIDGRLAGTTPLTNAIELPSGYHLVAITKNGKKPLVREMVLGRGEEKSFEFDLPNTRQRKTAIAFTAIAGVSAVGGVLAALAAGGQQGRAQNIIKKRNEGNISSDDADAYDNALVQRTQWRNAAGVGFGAAFVFAATAVVLFGFDRPSVTAPASRFETKQPETAPKPKEPSPMEMSAAPWVLPGSAGLGMVGRF